MQKQMCMCRWRSRFVDVECLSRARVPVLLRYIILQSSHSVRSIRRQRPVCFVVDVELLFSTKACEFLPYELCIP